jgi:hypothetical protein
MKRVKRKQRSLGPANVTPWIANVELRALDWVRHVPFDTDDRLNDCVCDGCQARELANVIFNHGKTKR